MTLRSWATPVTIGSFAIMAVTGTLMFFHLDTGLNKGVHEWAGLAMIAAVVAHLALNWRAFTVYFRRPVAVAIVAAGVAVLGASFLPLGGAAGGPEAAQRAMMGAMGRAPIEQVAELAGRPAEAVIADLQGKGYAIRAGQTLNDALGADFRAQAPALGTIFSSGE